MQVTYFKNKKKPIQKSCVVGVYWYKTNTKLVRNKKQTGMKSKTNAY